MTTIVTKTANANRMVTGKLAPYIDIDWADYSLDELKDLLQHAIRFEIEHNFRRHKDYKDRVGANIEIAQHGLQLKVMSLGDELLVVQDFHLA